jgi:hypothetical protein
MDGDSIDPREPLYQTGGKLFFVATDLIHSDLLKVIDRNAKPDSA